MGEGEYGWTLFALCKERGMTTSYIYSVMMYYSFHCDPSKEGMNKSFALFHEMTKEQNLIPTAMVDAVLIDICGKMGAFDRGYDVIQKIQNSKHCQVLMSSQTLLLSIAKLYVKSGNIDYGLKFMFKLYKTYRVVPNTMQCHYLLKGIADAMDKYKSIEEKQRYLYFAQKLFDFAFNKNKGDSPPIRVFMPFLNIFAKLGDHETCIELIKCMKDNEEYPNPDVICCGTALTSLRCFNRDHYHRMDIEVQRQYIEDIFGVMDSVKIKRNSVFSFVLMQIYAQHRNSEMIQNVYQQIGSKTERDVTGMSRNMMDCLRLKKQNGQNVDDEMQGMISWIMEQYTAYIAVPLTEQQQAIEKFEHLLESKRKEIQQL